MIRNHQVLGVPYFRTNPDGALHCILMRLGHQQRGYYEGISFRSSNGFFRQLEYKLKCPVVFGRSRTRHILLRCRSSTEMYRGGKPESKPRSVHSPFPIDLWQFWCFHIWFVPTSTGGSFFLLFQDWRFWLRLVVSYHLWWFMCLEMGINHGIMV